LLKFLHLGQRTVFYPFHLNKRGRKPDAHSDRKKSPDKVSSDRGNLAHVCNIDSAQCGVGNSLVDCAGVSITIIRSLRPLYRQSTMSVFAFVTVAPLVAMTDIRIAYSLK
jgi:hypothetical protein